ncbi:helix-turn-helix domain-containing protein [Priestia megaterium]|uniref:helix-turn-helix domain-containing protein n=1 Tax=Priestia megaterium TaxID=1404 RepID=UPI0031FBC2F7
MEKDYEITGKLVRIARLIKNVKIIELSEMTGIDDNYLAKIERGVEGTTISRLNHFRLVRALQELGYTEQQLVAITALVENIEELEGKNK